MAPVLAATKANIRLTRDLKSGQPAKTSTTAGHPVDAAKLIFKAIVTQINASNEPTVPKGPGLVIARVDCVVKASSDLGNSVGQEVTIELANKRPGIKHGNQ